MQRLLSGYQTANKRMIMLADCLAVGRQPVLFADIVLKAVTFFAFVMQPTSHIGKTTTAEGVSKLSCQVCDMISMVLNRLDHKV